MLIHRVAYRVITLTVLTVLAGLCAAQCDFLFDLDIPDNSSQTVEITVSGLLNDDLANGQQVCGLNLEFRHDYLGDLSIELVSPSGQSIRLVGDITDLINPTNLSTWNIGFVPCSGSPMPDPGFINTFNNDQSWEVFSNYTGTYFPYSGCLEDFNNGSANGTWQIIINDAAAPATGVFVSAEIIFCDNTGLLCSLCPADAGYFVQSSIDICEGLMVPPGSFDIDYDVGPPDPDSTNLTFIVANGSQPVVFTDFPYTYNWTVGSYSVCALSYDIEDSVDLFDIIDTMTLNEIHDVLQDGPLDICADVSDQCIEVTIRSTPAPVSIDETICSGQVYTIGGQTFDQPGMYDVMLSTLSGCDSLVRLNLDVIDVVARINQSDTLTCDMTTISLDASSSTTAGVPVFQWGSVAGGIVGPTNTPSIQITAPGVYSVTVTSLPSGCQAVRSWDVITNGSQPVVFLEEKVIDCANPTVSLSPLVFPSNATYQWSGPGGFASTLKSPSVSAPGVYWLVATDPGGCSATQSVNVSIDTLIAVETSIRSIIDCDISQTELAARPATIEEMLWSGPGGFTSTNRVVGALDPGLYTLTATYPNGCIDSASILIDLDYDIPDVNITASIDSLGCGDISILTAQSSESDITFDWSSAFFSAFDTSAITVITPGEYAVEGSAANGCFGYDTIEVFAGANLPQLNTFTDTLNCLKDTALIGVLTTASIIDYKWSGPALVDSFTDFIRVASPGVYSVELTDISGCLLFANIEVAQDFEPPRIRISSDTLTCLNTAATMVVTPLDPIVDISWTLNGIQLGTDSFLVVDRPGRYRVSATGENGCPGIRNHDLPFDTLSPLIYIQSAGYGCYDSLSLDLTPIDSIVEYAWNGPGGFISNAQDPFIYGPGNYTVVVTGPNGCMREQMTIVPLMAEQPIVIMETELLDCVDSVAVFRASTPDTLATYSWNELTGAEVADSNVAVLSDPGVYILEVVGYNNCSYEDTFNLAPPVTPAIFAEGDTINCRDSEVDLIVGSDSTMMTFSWFDSEGAPVASGPTFRASSPGVYTITGMWTNGCRSDTTVRVYIDTLRPIAVAITDGSVRCDIRELYVSGTGSVGDSLDYQWDALYGSILLGDTRDSAYVQGPGEFVLTVIEQRNHCLDKDTVLVEEEASTLDFMDLNIIPECQGNLAGAIIIDSVHEADSPLEYFIGLNGGSLSPVFDSLEQGQYRLSVVDSFGCRLDTLVFVTETSSEATVSLGPDREILIGDQVVLEATLDVDPSSLSAIFWEPALPCDSCLSNEDEPLVTTDYVIFVRDEFGCLAQDVMRVYVIERGQLYVPNVFTPNGDGVNDAVTVTAHPGVRLIREFSIIDRWGDLMYSVTNADPHSSVIAWDGRFGGKDLNPAAYSYIMKVELLTGRMEILTGDITLIR